MTKTSKPDTNITKLVSKPASVTQIHEERVWVLLSDRNSAACTFSVAFTFYMEIFCKKLTNLG